MIEKKTFVSLRTGNVSIRGALVLVIAGLLSTSWSCRRPYERSALVLETAAGIEALRTIDWSWGSCSAQQFIPNAYRAVRPDYTLILVHSNEPHLVPEFFMAATTHSGKYLNIEGPAVKEGPAVGIPVGSLATLRVSATHRTDFTVLPDRSGVLLLNISGEGVHGHEELKFKYLAMSCYEREGP